jgi:hypothetical protein
MTLSNFFVYCNINEKAKRLDDDINYYLYTTTMGEWVIRLYSRNIYPVQSELEFFPLLPRSSKEYVLVSFAPFA